MLDKWAGNADGRQAVFSRKRRARKYHATFIDQGYCLNACEWTFPDAALRGVYGRNCVYEHVTGWDAFEPALTKAEEADPLDIWRCADPIPPEWHGHNASALEQLVETLHSRRRKIRDLITAFRESTRNPFPKLARMVGKLRCSSCGCSRTNFPIVLPDLSKSMKQDLDRRSICMIIPEIVIAHLVRHRKVFPEGWVTLRGFEW